ncbi:hypothetical protein AAG570_002675 [Ranatra chinensis]|uniref:Uncharacterized protein n=1 Tax=Ranatra chinensis TaxID=642074 RepID=A0ABD0YWP4_9HEMI
MVLSAIVGRLKAALLFLVGVIRRSLCCFRRRRKSSVDSVPLTTIGIVPSFEPDPSFQDGCGWSDWNDPGAVEGPPPPPSTVQQHIEHYRRHHKQQPTQQQQNEEQQDMEPEIKRQTKDTGELGCWEEGEERGSWAEAEGWAAQEMLRQQRREEQHRKRNQDKDQRRTLGARLASAGVGGPVPNSPPS